jgi:hypothetical protein
MAAEAAIGAAADSVVVADSHPAATADSSEAGAALTAAAPQETGDNYDKTDIQIPEQ